MALFSRLFLAMALALALPLAAVAQGTGVSLSGLKQDPGLPVEVGADQLSIDQATGIATFSGNVVIVQGAMKLSAASVVVEYLQGESGSSGRINRLIARNAELVYVSKKPDGPLRVFQIHEVELRDLSFDNPKPSAFSPVALGSFVFGKPVK